jgi:NAD(P)H-nitrite reductase large subunit
MLPKSIRDYFYTMRYIIIGSGIAGVSAAKSIRAYDNTGDVHLYTNEIHPLGLANRQAMARLFAKKKVTPNQLALETEESLAAQGIVLEYHTELSIFPHLGLVQKPHVVRATYDRLLIATGSTPLVLDVPGVHLMGVHQVWNYDDLSLLESLMGDLQKRGAVVIGGGLMALEMAYALGQRGIPVTLIVRENQIGAPLFEAALGHLWQAKLEADGVRVILGQTVTAFLGEDDALLDAVQLSDGSLVAARVAINAIGVYGNGGLLEEAGAAYDEQTGTLVVDSHLRTNLANIYAAGACASVAGRVSRHWRSAEEQGRIAGLNMVGFNLSYQPLVEGNLATMAYGLPLAYFGQRTANAEARLVTQSKTDFGAWYYEGSRLVGAVGVGALASAVRAAHAEMLQTLA